MCVCVCVCVCVYVCVCVCVCVCVFLSHPKELLSCLQAEEHFYELLIMEACCGGL